MRTTLTIDSDVAAKAKEAVRKTGLPFKTLINDALRVGIDAVMAPKSGKPYRTQGRPMGLKPGLNYDNLHQLLERGEGEHYR